jgi:hypothetical protein
MDYTNWGFVSTSIDVHTLDKHGKYFSLKRALGKQGSVLHRGSKVLETNIAETNSAAYTLLTKLGYVYIGDTLCDEFTIGVSGLEQNIIPDFILKNPVNPAVSRGGSSTGAAVSRYFLKNFNYLALGSSTGGSIIQPRRLVKVYRFVPERGLISREGLIDHAPSLDRIGFLTGNLERLEEIMNACVPPQKILFRNLIHLTNDPLSSYVKNKLEKEFSFMDYAPHSAHIQELYYQLAGVEFYSGYQKYLIKDPLALEKTLWRVKKRYRIGEQILKNDTKYAHLSLLEKKGLIEKEFINLLKNSDGFIYEGIQEEALNSTYDSSNDMLGNFVDELCSLQFTEKTGHSITLYAKPEKILALYYKVKNLLR